MFNIIILSSICDKRVDQIKTIRELFTRFYGYTIGLKEAKDLITNSGVLCVSKEDLFEVMAALDKVEISYAVKGEVLNIPSPHIPSVYRYDSIVKPIPLP